MRALSLLIKPASGLCNMRCRYCFYADVTDIRQVKSRGMMTPDTLETIVKRALSETTELCTFGFQGGEPTLAGLDFYRKLIAFEQAHNQNRVKIVHALQTNGLAIDEEWAAFLAENHFLTGISIDASKQVHDELRVDADGKGTHLRALNAVALLEKHKAEYNILSVVTGLLAAHPDKAYRFYKQRGFRYIQFIPCLDGLQEEHGAHAYSLSAEAYGKFLCRIFDLWYEDLRKGIYLSIRTFDNFIHMLAGHPPENCAMTGVCHAYPLIEADGSVYPCDFYAVDEFLLGNVGDHSFREMLESPAAKAFMVPSLQKPPACLACEYLPICRGGCRRDCEPITGGALSRNHYCEAYRMFFSHALPRMEQISRTLPQ